MLFDDCNDYTLKFSLHHENAYANWAGALHWFVAAYFFVDDAVASTTVFAAAVGRHFWNFDMESIRMYRLTLWR